MALDPSLSGVRNVTQDSAELYVTADSSASPLHIAARTSGAFTSAQQVIDAASAGDIDANNWGQVIATPTVGENAKTLVGLPLSTQYFYGFVQEYDFTPIANNPTNLNGSNALVFSESATPGPTGLVCWDAVNSKSTTASGAVHWLMRNNPFGRWVANGVPYGNRQTFLFKRDLSRPEANTHAWVGMVRMGSSFMYNWDTSGHTINLTTGELSPTPGFAHADKVRYSGGVYGDGWVWITLEFTAEAGYVFSTNDNIAFGLTNEDGSRTIVTSAPEVAGMFVSDAIPSGAESLSAFILGSFTTAPHPGNHEVTDTSSASDQKCIYFGQVPAIQIGDQFSYKTSTGTNGWGVDIDGQGYPIIDKGDEIPSPANPPPIIDIILEDDFNRPDSPLSDDDRWMDVPTRTGLSVRSNQCQSLLLHRANLSVVVADSNCGMKYTVSEGPESGVFMGLRWSADGQNGYRWNINAGVAALFGLRNGQEASIDGIENVPQEVGDVFEIRAFGASHYLLRNSQLLGKIDDTEGVGPGEVAGHVYLGLMSSMKIDDFSCGNLATDSFIYTISRDNGSTWEPDSTWAFLIGEPLGDRDTVSQPYKMSNDGVCYLRYPNGDAPVVTVADYAELRTKGSGDAGYASIIVVDGERLGGRFQWSSADPYGVGDDGALVIAATDGWWVRQVLGSIHLDWWDLGDYSNITPVLQQLSDNSSLLDVDILVPQYYQNSYIDQVSFTTKRNIYIRGVVGNRHTFWQSDMFAYDGTLEYLNGPENSPTGQPGIGDCRSLILANAEVIHISEGIRFYGRDDCQAYLRFHERKAIVEVTCGTTLSTLYMGWDSESPIRDHVNFTDGGQTFAKTVVTFAGKFDGGGIGGGGNVFAKLVFVPGCELNDKHGISLGRDRNNPTAQGDPIKFRGGGYHYGLAARTEGRLIMRWGQRLGGATTGGRDGTDVIYDLYDLGYTEADPNGTQHGFWDQVGTGKWDGFGNYAESPPGTVIRDNPCKYVYNWYNKAKVWGATVYEASPDAPGDNKWVANFDLRFNYFNGAPEDFVGTSMGASTIAIDSEGGGENRIYKNTFSGECEGISLADGPNTVHDLTIHSGGISVSRGREGWPDDRVPVDVTFTDVTLRDSCMVDHADINQFTIRIYFGNPVVFTRLKTTAVPPTEPTIVLGARGDNNPSFDPTNAPCVVHINEHQLHPGTRIEPYFLIDERQQVVKLFVDGVEITDFLTNGWTA